MHILASRLFSTKPKLSKVYAARISIGSDRIINIVLTMAGSAIGLFQEMMQTSNSEIKITQAPMQDGHTPVTCCWQTDSHTLISTINGLKESFLISIEFADEICRELPNFIQRVKHSQLAMGAHHPIPTLTLNDTLLKDEEWSTKICTMMDPLSLSQLYNSNPVLHLTESEARAIIKVYCDGCFLIFRKNETHHLLAKVNSEIRQFDILTKRQKKLPPYSPLPYLSFDLGNGFGQLFFNLKNEKGDLVFNTNGVSATSLYSFLKTPELKQQFPFQLNLRGVKIFGQKADSLKTLAIKQLLIQDPSLSWLPSLPHELQEQALLYFLDTFITELSYLSDFQSFMRNHLFNANSSCPFKYRKHYSIEEIEKNLGYLRALYQKGNTKAAMVLASIVYVGLIEYSDDNAVELRMYLFPQPTPKKKEKVLFQLLEEYREITQNTVHFPDKIVRDIFLLRYFEAKQDKKMIDTQLKHIDLGQAVWLDSKFFGDHTILSCIELEENGLQQLKSNKQILHDLITLGRSQLANFIKHTLPEEVLREKGKDDRNILHTLVEHLIVHAFGSRPVLDIFNFVCERFPDMLAESDSQGHTVYDDIERLKLHCDVEIREEIESTLAISIRFKLSTP